MPRIIFKKFTSAKPSLGGAETCAKSQNSEAGGKVLIIVAGNPSKNYQQNAERKSGTVARDFPNRICTPKHEAAEGRQIHACRCTSLGGPKKDFRRYIPHRKFTRGMERIGMGEKAEVGRR